MADLLSVLGVTDPHAAAKPAAVAAAPWSPPAGVDPSTDYLVRTVYGETTPAARADERQAVAAVALNRARLGKKSVADVVLEPGQFEPWEDAKARARITALKTDDPQYQAILKDLGPVLQGNDPTGGATHFYAPKSQAALGRGKPEFDDGSGQQIGDSVFFKHGYGGQAAAPPKGLAELLGVDPDAPAQSAPGADAGVYDPTTGRPYNDAQAKTLRGLQTSGQIEMKDGVPLYKGRPLLAMNGPDDKAPDDTYYVDLAGKLHGPPQFSVGDEIKRATAKALDSVALGMSLTNPMLSTALGQNERVDAVQQGGMSGLLLGGKNELLSGVGALTDAATGRTTPNLEDVVAGRKGGIVGRFDQHLKELDTHDAELAAKHPLLFHGSQVGGSLAGTILMPEIRGGSMLARAGMGAATNSAVGGAQGFLGTDGTLEDRVSGAEKGAVLGGLFGGVLGPLGGRSAVKGAGVAADAPGMSKEEFQAANALVRAAQRDGTSLGDIAAKAQASGALPLAAGGENLGALGEVLAQTPGSARTTLHEAIAERQAGASGRVQAQIGDSLGAKGDYFATLEKVVKDRATAAKSGMAEIGGHEVTLDQNSVQALRSDLAKGAIKEAAQNALASADADVRASGARLNRLADDLLDKPSAVTVTVRDAQDISRSLLDAADSAYKSGNGSRGASLKTLGKAVRDNAQDPERGGFTEYGAWLKKYGDDSENKDALELGRQILSGKQDMSSEKLAKTVGEFSDASKDFFRKGVAEALLAQARSGKGGVGAMRELLRNQEFRDRVRLAFPDQAGFDKFMASAKQEAEEAGRYSRATTGSPTYPRTAAADDLKAQSGVDPIDAAIAAHDIVTLNMPRLMKEALKRLPRQDRSIMGNSEASQALAGGLTDPNVLIDLATRREAQAARQAQEKGRVLGRAPYLISRALGAEAASATSPAPR